jgi:phenylacetate-CoA ligase
MRLFKRFRPTHYLTYPTKLYDLGEEIKGLGEEPSLLNLRALLIGGEGCEKEKRAKMETLWDAPIYEALTTTEAGLYGYECKPYEGLHVLESRIIFATCKPEQGEILGEGEEGDDLVTTLYDVGERPGIFLINYSHGDVTKILSTERCECDRTFVKIDYIKRKDEIINLRAVKFYAREPERVPGIKDYICILNKEEGLLEIRVVAEKDYTPERLMKEVLDVFYATNPAAANFVGKYINVKIVEREELHRGLQIPPGKPVRLVVV